MDQEAHKITCPFCWQKLDVLVDPATDADVSQQQYTEDCQVCCHPILITVTTDFDGAIQLNAEAE